MFDLQHTVTVWLLDTLVMVHVLRGRNVRDFMLCPAGGSSEGDMLCCITVEDENDVSDRGREGG